MGLENPRNTADIASEYFTALEYHNYDRPHYQESIESARDRFQKRLDALGIKDMVHMLATTLTEGEISAVASAARSKLIDYTEFLIIAENEHGYKIEVG